MMKGSSTLHKPRIGVSSCLLGSPVRFNGDHQRHEWVADILAQQVELVACCPEMAMGLGTPRPAMRLASSPKLGIRLKTVKTGEDLTELANRTVPGLVDAAKGLDGYILKKNSPSCGYERVKIYHEGRMPTRTGRGFFATALRERNALLPIIEEGRLADPEQRENFVLRVYAYLRLKETELTMKGIQTLHRQHKFLLLEHSPKHYAKLGRIVGNPDRRRAREVFADYGSLFMEALEIFPTRRTRTNVLQHVLGFLRDSADLEDRRQVAELIALYHRGEVPFISPLTMLAHLAQKMRVDYLEDQLLFSPYPRALGAQARL